MSGQDLDEGYAENHVSEESGVSPGPSIQQFAILRGPQKHTTFDFIEVQTQPLQQGSDCSSDSLGLVMLVYFQSGFSQVQEKKQAFFGSWIVGIQLLTIHPHKGGEDEVHVNVPKALPWNGKPVNFLNTLPSTNMQKTIV